MITSATEIATEIQADSVPDEPSVGIVGGGVLGMYLALTLARRGCRVTLFEAGGKTGGLASPQEIGDFTWDRFYHVILLSDSNTRELLEDLGLAEDLRWGLTKTGFYTDGKLYSMSNTLEFLSFPPLNLIDKIRLGATIFFAARMKDWRRLEQVRALDWLRRWSGRNVVNRIWEPLLRSKLGANSEIASAAFIWAIIARMYAARRSGLKQEMFGYVEGGYEAILDSLQARLDEAGVETVFDARVDQVQDVGSGSIVHFNDTESREFGHSVLTVPTNIIARLCPQLSAGERERMNDVTYQGVLCASILLRKPLAEYYVTNITDRWVPFTGVIEMTTLVDPNKFGGHSLVYLPCYLTADDAYWDASDEQVREDFLAALEKMYTNFDRSDVVVFSVSRARQVLAVSTLDYSQNAMPSVETSQPNISILNSARIANGTLNVNETLGVVLADIDMLWSRMNTAERVARR